jgi:hypothetical protein
MLVPAGPLRFEPGFTAGAPIRMGQAMARRG